MAFWSDGAQKIYDFMQGVLAADIAFTRASSAWYFNSSGNLTIATSNVPRFDYGSPGSTTLQGLLMEESRINKALQCRDLTQAAWTLLNATAALDQTGIDGSVNTASSLTATAANATALQVVTQAAASSVFSVYLKRITGTGTINITQDGGGTWQTVTLTSRWQRFSHNLQSTLNPLFGVQIVTNGDVIGFDGAQFEGTPGANALATSLILTTTVAVTRAAEGMKSTSVSWFNQTKGTFVVDGIYGSINAGIGFNFMAEFSDNSTNNRYDIYLASDVAIMNVSAAGGAGQISAGSATIANSFKEGATYNTKAEKLCLNGGTVSTGAVTTPGAVITQLNFGCRADVTRQPNSWLQKFRYWNYVLSNEQLKRVTA